MNVAIFFEYAHTWRALLSSEHVWQHMSAIYRLLEFVRTRLLGGRNDRRVEEEEEEGGVL